MDCGTRHEGQRNREVERDRVRPASAAEPFDDESYQEERQEGRYSRRGVNGCLFEYQRIEHERVSPAAACAALPYVNDAGFHSDPHCLAAAGNPAAAMVPRGAQA